MSDSCPVCSSSRTVGFIAIKGQPVLIGTLWPDAKAAKNTPTGDLRLVFCSECGFIWNEVFDPSLLAYSQTYENSLHFSGVFQDYTTEVVNRLVNTYDIRDKDVIDIGCGKGDFLAMLCEAGQNRGVGFDPSYEGDRITGPVAERLTFIQDLYSNQYSNLQADLLTSRYVFEHVQNPLGFLEMILGGLERDTEALIYFEVPNVRLILEELSVWDIIYEHCNCFGLESLGAAFERADFGILDLRETYRRQFVSVDARYQAAGVQQSWGDLAQLTALVADFTVKFQERLSGWHSKFESMKRKGKRAIAWGAGAKAVGFLNMLEIDDARMPCVVDINPHKQGTYLGGTGQEVVSPESLKELRPDAIVLMNPIYKNEIATQVSKLGLSVEFIDA